MILRAAQAYRLVLLLALPIILVGCYYKSDTFILSDTKAHNASSYFPLGTHYFVAKNNLDYLEVVVSPDGTSVTSKSVKPGSDDSRKFDGLRAVQVGATWDSQSDFHVAYHRTSSGKYEYFTFLWNETSIFWISAAKAGQEVTSLSDLRQKVNLLQRSGRAEEYSMVSPPAARQLIAKDRAEQASSDAKNAAKASRPPAPTPSLTSKLDVGDGVYVQGFFSDELAIIVRIDHQNQKVKVRRSRDGTTKWVAARDVLTREQSTINDIGRGAVTIGIIACFFSPESCKK